MLIVTVGLIMHQACQFEDAEHILSIIAGRAIAAERDRDALVERLYQRKLAAAQAQVTDRIMHNRRATACQQIQVARFQPDSMRQRSARFEHAHLIQIGDTTLPEHLPNDGRLHLRLDGMQVETCMVALSQFEAGIHQLRTTPVDAAGPWQAAQTTFGAIVPGRNKVLQGGQLVIDSWPAREAINKGVAGEGQAMPCSGLQYQIAIFNRWRNCRANTRVAIGAHRGVQVLSADARDRPEMIQDSCGAAIEHLNGSKQCAEIDKMGRPLDHAIGKEWYQP